MYNSTEEYLIREALYGDKKEIDKHEIQKLTEEFYENIPTPHNLNKDGTPDMRFKKNQEWYNDSFSKYGKKCREENAKYQSKVKNISIEEARKMCGL
jgi:hypothetical protein